MSASPDGGEQEADNGESRVDESLDRPVKMIRKSRAEGMSLDKSGEKVPYDQEEDEEMEILDDPIGRGFLDLGHQLGATTKESSGPFMMAGACARKGGGQSQGGSRSSIMKVREWLRHVRGCSWTGLSVWDERRLSGKSFGPWLRTRWMSTEAGWTMI